MRTQPRRPPRRALRNACAPPQSARRPGSGTCARDHARRRTPTRRLPGIGPPEAAPAAGRPSGVAGRGSKETTPPARPTRSAPSPSPTCLPRAPHGSRAAGRARAIGRALPPRSPTEGPTSRPSNQSKTPAQRARPSRPPREAPRAGRSPETRRRRADYRQSCRWRVEHRSVRIESPSTHGHARRRTRRRTRRRARLHRPRRLRSRSPRRARRPRLCGGAAAEKR